MSTIAAVAQTTTHALPSRTPPTRSKELDGDTPAQEAAESLATKTAEKQGGGTAPRAATSVDIKV